MKNRAFREFGGFGGVGGGGENNKMKKALFLIILIFLIIFLIRLFSGEDNWICQNGEWIMHGHPSTPKPTTVCLQSLFIPNQTSSNASSNKTQEAISLLESVPEIQTIKKAVLANGRKPFYTPENENGDIVRISLRESFPDDPHTSRIETFNVNIKSKNITVEDIVSGKDISLADWEKTVKERFPEK